MNELELLHNEKLKELYTEWLENYAEEYDHDRDLLIMNFMLHIQKRLVQLYEN